MPSANCVSSCTGCLHSSHCWEAHYDYGVSPRVTFIKSYCEIGGVVESNVVLRWVGLARGGQLVEKRIAFLFKCGDYYEIDRLGIKTCPIRIQSGWFH